MAKPRVVRDVDAVQALSAAQVEANLVSDSRLVSNQPALTTVPREEEPESIENILKWLETAKQRETFKVCPKPGCELGGGTLDVRWVLNGHSEKKYFYIYWKHSAGKRRSCYLGPLRKFRGLVSLVSNHSATSSAGGSK